MPVSLTASACAKAQRHRYKNNDMADLEAKLQEASGCQTQNDCHRRRVLPMDGYIANLSAICDLR